MRVKNMSNGKAAFRHHTLEDFFAHVCFESTSSDMVLCAQYKSNDKLWDFERLGWYAIVSSLFQLHNYYTHNSLLFN